MEEKQTTYRIGPIRPPSEANSLLLQITGGCTWNRCKFCSIYKHERFRVFSVDSIKRDIDVMAEYADMVTSYMNQDGTLNKKTALSRFEGMTQEEKNCYYLVYRWLAGGGENVFLQDGNSLAVKTERVLEVLRYLREKLPSIKRVTTYGRAETLAKISADEYTQLKKAGLDRIHSGFESGSDQVLQLIDKGVTAEQEILAGHNIKAGGIELSVYFMPGIGGKDLSTENALETARVVRAINPDFVRLRSAVIKEGTDLWQDYRGGRIRLCSENDKLTEVKLLIENSQGCTGYLASDHIINLLQNVEGRLDADSQNMLAKINEYFALPPLQQKLFQLARRCGMVSEPSDLLLLAKDQRLRLEQSIRSITEEVLWDEKMNEILMDYI
ncbi:radical SAM protein [Anoxybacterium hadale]|uniref:Radical SAM protein n=1 Tax=Anoxybacterium hadale TaxID=3408580 RepID=A0ACD1ADI2_9FIRM|nr:radical SAM protein [Clostridiales bacterium]